jgi:hypothetical protein
MAAIVPFFGILLDFGNIASVISATHIGFSFQMAKFWWDGQNLVTKLKNLWIDRQKNGGIQWQVVFLCFSFWALRKA